jgi:hypothetical protein
MNKFIKLWLHFSPLCFAFWPFRRESPTDEDVRRELLRISKGNLFNFSFDKINFDSFFAATSMLAWIVFILALLLGSMYFLRSVSPYLRNDSVWRDSKKTLFPKKDLVQGKSILNYQQALNQAEVGEYRQAIISLHKATVDCLLSKVITSSAGKKYTNNDLKKKLKGDSNLYQPFALIADYAEIASFSTIDLNHEDFRETLTTYEKNFLLL